VTTIFDAANKGAGHTISGSSLTITHTGTNGTDYTTRLTTSRTTPRKSYAEFTIVALGGTQIGLADSGAGKDAYYLGLDGHSIGLLQDGRVLYNGANPFTMNSLFVGAVIGIATDHANELIWFKVLNDVSNVFWNFNSNADPATGVGGQSFAALTAAAFLAAHTSVSNGQITANVGGSAFFNTAPSGYLAWDRVFAETPTESVTFFQSNPEHAAFPGVLTGSMTLTEAAAAGLAFIEPQSETITLAEAMPAAVAFPASLSGSASFSDAATSGLAFIEAQEEDLTLADVNTDLLKIAVSRLETLTLSEDLTDSLVGVQPPASALGVLRPVKHTYKGGVKFNPKEDRPWNIGDIDIPQPLPGVSHQGIISFSDFLSAVGPVHTPPLVESVHFSDLLVQGAQNVGVLTGSITLVATKTAKHLAKGAVNESINLSEIPNSNVKFPGARTESVTFTDAVVGTISAGISSTSLVLAQTPLPNGFSVSRNAAAWYFSGVPVAGLGTLTQVAANQPRWYFDSLGNKGILLEPSSQNFAASPTMAGAINGVYGSGGQFPTGWVIEKDLFGLNFLKILFCDKAVANTQGQPQTVSCFIRRTSVSFNSPLHCGVLAREYNSAGTFIDEQSVTVNLSGNTDWQEAKNNLSPIQATVAFTDGGVIFDGTSSPSTVTISNVGTNVNGAPRLTLRIQGTAHDFTVDLICPQIEKMPDRTAPMLNAVVRPAEKLVHVPATAGYTFSSAVGTAIVTFQTISDVTYTDPVDLLKIHDGTANDTMKLTMTGARALSATITDGGVSQVNLALGSVAAKNTQRKAGIAYAVNNVRAGLNANANKPDTLATMPTATQIEFGGNTGKWPSLVVAIWRYDPATLNEADFNTNVGTTLASGNAAPTDILLSNNTLPTGAAQNTVVGTLTPIDADDTTWSYAITGGADASFFNLSAASGATSQLRYQTGTLVQDDVLVVEVTATDSAANAFPKTFNVTVQQAATPITLTPTSGLASSVNGQIFENLDITPGPNQNGLDINHNGVTVRNCRINRLGMIANTHAVRFTRCVGGSVASVRVIKTDKPASGRLPLTGGTWPDFDMNGIYLWQCSGPWTIDRIHVNGVQRGLFVTGSNGITSGLATNLQLEDCRATTGDIAGDFIQVNVGANFTFRDFSGFNDVNIAWTEDNLSCINGTNILFENGIVQGNNSPTGAQIQNEQVCTNVIWRNIDVIKGCNAAIFTYASNIRFENCRIKDGYGPCGNGRGNPSSNGCNTGPCSPFGLMCYIAGGSNVHFINCQWWNWPGAQTHILNQGPATNTLQMVNADFVPRAFINLTNMPGD
jgi:hypothetical protein